MRRISVIVLMAVAFLVGSMTLTSADAHNRDDHRGNSFRLVSITDQFQDIDVGDTGPSLGDYFVFHDKVYYHRKQVGALNGQCTTTYLTSTEGAQQCLVTASLPKGDLTVHGIVAFQLSEEEPGDATLAVTGGTGRYAGAGGEVRVHFVSDEKSIIDVYLN